MRTAYLFRGAYHSQPNIEIEQYETFPSHCILRLRIVNKRHKTITKISLTKENIKELTFVLNRLAGDAK